jgi:DNA-binding SARP family transcriptional activator/tetratricopeptide (TPR) repeat protein
MARMPGPETSVDTPLGQSVSFAAPHSLRPATQTDPWLPVAVGPGRPRVGQSNHGALDGMTGYPIQPAKVQRPPLRDETLARDRLLDWVAAKIHHRVVLILADAGYGKTTLLADFSRRTRVRTLWYRLDDDDRDWMSFLTHLVAAGREHDPEFAPHTAAILSDMAMGGPTREAATDVFLAELPSIAEHGAILILDDYHLVDESAEVRLITRELVARAPERLSIIFASRHAPSIPLARLRSSGEVAELGTDDLRFDAVETARLFTETYGRDLEPDVIADVAARTEGWAASLQLVQAALRDRSPGEIRRFVRSLTGADQELYDYLAEEVVGDLAEDLQRFLMRTSILQVVSADLAAVVTDLDETEVSRLTAAAERLTLLSRPSRTSRGPQRYHPLVREFLEARLRSWIGDAAVARLHHQVAEAAANLDWRIAAYHFREAGDPSSVASTIAKAIPEIMGSGMHSAADEEIKRIPQESRVPVLSLVVSRIQMQSRQEESAMQLSHSVLDLVNPGTVESDYALLNLITLSLQRAGTERTRPLARRLRDTTSNEDLRLIADGVGLMLDATVDGSLGALVTHLAAMADRQRGIHDHFYGVTMLNLAIASTLQDEVQIARGAADEAVEALEGTSSQIELAAALMARAYVLTLLGLEDDAEEAMHRASRIDQLEVSIERAELADSYTDPDAAEGLLTALNAYPGLIPRGQFAIQASWFYARRGRHDEATEVLSRASREDFFLIAQQSAQLVTKAYLAIVSRSSEAPAFVAQALDLAISQQATGWQRVAELMRASLGTGSDLNSAIVRIGAAAPWHVTYLADLVCERLDDLDESARSIVDHAARLHPGRWRFVLRECIRIAGKGEGLRAALLLEAVGELSDVPRLRTYARRQARVVGASGLGRPLARRLATRVLVRDQDRVTIHVGDRHIQGSSIRRKVLGLLCFLLTKPTLSSTRDQVLDALWPDLSPLDAVNSLNQTVYFLRRVLEEPYVDDLSPGYLHHDSDLIWLDPELVTSSSNQCRGLIKSLPVSPSPDQVLALVDAYKGRFALDFEYEEWASPYRDWLHASFLEIVERAVADDTESGHFERGINLARRVLDVDQGAEHVEVSLLRLYRASGAHAAAAEQYSHYATTMREQLGVEPPPLDAI